MTTTKLSLCFIQMLLIFVALAGETQSQIYSGVIGPTGEIPHGFRSWSLFIVCNPTWLSKEHDTDLSNLHDRFIAFGRAIGKDNDAVWFWKERMYPGKLTVEQVDVERSIGFAKAYGIKCSSTPSILVVSDYPNPAKPANWSAR